MRPPLPWNRLTLCRLSLLGSLLLAPVVAAAQQTADERATSARSEYRRAHEAARRSDWPEARRILRELWTKSKTYDVAASLSEAEYALGNAAAAARYMDYALSHVTPNESAATVENMKAALAQLRPQVALLELSVDDPDASIELDGEPLELGPESRVFVEPGSHLIRARAAGRTSAATVDASAGSVRTVRLQLRESSAPAPRPATPLPASEAPGAGPRPRTIALLIGGALALGGAATGIGFGVASNSCERDAERYRARVGASGCPSPATSADCGALRDAVDSQRQQSRLANVGYGVAAAGLVTAGVALLWPARSRTESAARSSSLELRWAGDSLLLSSEF